MARRRLVASAASNERSAEPRKARLLKEFGAQGKKSTFMQEKKCRLQLMAMV